MKHFVNGARRFGQKALATGQDLVAGGMAATASFNTAGARLTRNERRFWTLLFLLAAGGNQAFAQGNITSVTTATNTLKNTVYTIAQGLFAIFLVVALVKVVKKFMSGEPDAMTSLFWLIGGLLIFFGFSALKQTLVGTGEAGGSAAGLIGQ